MITTNDGPAVVYEDAPMDARKRLQDLIGQNITINLPARIRGVGSKGMVIEVQDIYGEWQPVSVPIEKALVSSPS